MDLQKKDGLHEKTTRIVTPTCPAAIEKRGHILGMIVLLSRYNGFKSAGGTNCFRMQSAFDDQFLARLANGEPITSDEYDQIAHDIPDEHLAEALAHRFERTGETRMLIEAARLFLRARQPYQALEVCSRRPNLPEIRQVIQRALPMLQRLYPETRQVGKLLEEAFLVIDLQTGQMTRFPPLITATSLEPVRGE